MPPEALHTIDAMHIPLLNTLREILTSKVALLSIGGAIGTNARYWLSVWFNEASWRTPGTWLSAFPMGTFVINVTGSFVLGLVGVAFVQRMPEHRAWFLLLGTGFCGGYTTFSTFEWETLQLVRTGSWWLVAANLLGSGAVGFLGVWLGALLGELIFRNG
jgi:fluoride exporter